MAAAIQFRSVDLAVLFMGLSSFTVELSTPSAWTTSMDLGGPNVGTVSGAMNSIGQLGGAVAPALAAYFAQAGPSGWSIALYTAAAVYAAGLVCWVFLDPVTPLSANAY